ncbi:hypothetical protein M9H77_05581 [Catharanthus roseus]|uniref:Uncharacterized protein n=1 Tax=Catharanthus roseus TaxID=4058 RepID=A0ACC0CHB6_CATRO|nr:hypothetical protein M9H77_05581 [Catharanthus roseus]
MFESTIIARIQLKSIRSFSNSRFRKSKKSAMGPPPVLSLVLPSETGRVLSIQSHTVQGYVGNKSAVFPLQLLGYDVDPINSVQFSNHTGYPTFKGQVLNGEQLWDLIEGLEANELLYYTHLLTGYIGSVSFLNTVLKAVEKLRSINPNLTYVCDPVMGDEGKLYIPQELVSVYREKVVPVASMLTPNQFEAELLTGSRILSEQDGREACIILHAAGPSKVVITSINMDGNLLLIGSHQKEKGQPPAQFKIAIPRIPAYFTGTGDLMTALLLGWSNKYPDNLDKAAELAVSSVQALLARTLGDYRKAGYDCKSSSLEIRLIQSQDDIRNPEQTALELVKRGATLLLLDVPQYTLIGIDTQMFSSGPNFMGIKMIPPGVHFVYYSSSNREGSEFSPITGFFIDAQPSQVFVRKWNKEEEHFVKLPEEEEDRYTEAVKRMEFDRQLGPYNLDQYTAWRRLSNYITKDTIQRIACRESFQWSILFRPYEVFQGPLSLDVACFHSSAPLLQNQTNCPASDTPCQPECKQEPLGGEITVTCETDMTGNIPKTAMEKALADQLKNSKFARPVEKSQRKGCYYTSIPRVIKHKGLSGQELTNLNVDKTQLLESILLKEYGGAEDLLLAELQFAFIAFLMGQSLEAFLQWKLLVSLLFGCVEAPLHTRSGLFTKFIRVIHYQLKYGFQRDQKGSELAEKGVSALLDESWLSADSFLHHLCKDFFSLVLEAPVVDGDLLSWARKLKELLEDSLGWDFQQNSAVDGTYCEEDDESFKFLQYAPVVVMSEELLGNDAPTS